MELFQQIGLDGIIPRSVRPLIFVVVLIFSTKSDGNPITNPKTEYLESYSNLMKSYMNLSTDPCDDFFEYACGNYRNSSAPLRFRISSVNEVRNHLVGKTEHLMGRMDLAEAINATSELRVAQRFYKVCQAGYQQPFLATDPQYLTLIRSLGGFPALDGATWNASEFNWIKMSDGLSNYGAEGLIHEYSFFDYSFEAESSEPVLLGFDTVVQQDINASNSREVYQLNEERMRGYLRSFKLPENKIGEVIDGVFEFWRKLIMVESSDFENLDNVCASYPEAAANYLAMKLLYTFEAKHNASKTQGDYCETTLRYTMGYLFNKLFMAEHLTEETKLELREVRESLEKSLKETVWPFGGPLFFRSEYFVPFESSKLIDEMIQLIGRMEVVDDNYTATNINLQSLSVNITRFRTKNDFKDRLLLNDYLLAVLLQPPFYHPSWPFSMKFAALSYVLAPELLDYVHFSSGDLPSQFKDNVKCFQDRYNTTEPNILDFASLQLGYAAYQSQKKDLKQEEVSEQMPGLDLSPDQLYFLGFAQSLCYDYKYENGLKKYDILGSLSSSEAFNCPKGSGMRPSAETCRLF